jgi:hypothetical protein
MENNETPPPQDQTILGNAFVSFTNLEHRKDRLKEMTEMLEKRNLPVHRTPGILPREIIDKVIPRARLKVMIDRTPGAIGCHFAQVAVMEQALALGKHAWVMEDDLKICSDIHKRLDHIDKFCATHPWDIIWMGATFHINPPHWHAKRLGRDAECTDDPRMMKTYGCFCTYSYIVNKDSVKKVLRGLDHWLDKSMGIDWAMIQMQPSLNTFSFVPGCCIQRDGQSDIGYVRHKNGGKKPGVTIFSGFKKLGPYWWAQHMEDFDPTTFNWHEAKR